MTDSDSQPVLLRSNLERGDAGALFDPKRIADVFGVEEYMKNVSK
jgi:hypothetical protein